MSRSTQTIQQLMSAAVREIAVATTPSRPATSAETHKRWVKAVVESGQKHS